MNTVGNTPLLEVDGIYAKLECTNPCGSIKDRIAVYILEQSEARGLLRPGTRIVEATSGNTGIALSYFAKEKGYDITIVMPEDMTEERKEILKELGADLILCSKEGSFAEAAAIRDQMAEEKGYFNPDQFSNPLNTECHYETTGCEILQQMGTMVAGPIDGFVAGVGTGGTLMGVGKRIKAAYPGAYLVAVEPRESPVMSGGEPGRHGIFGIGDGFIPALVGDGRGGLDPLIDEVLCVGSEEAKEASQYLAASRGCCVGISSGANYLAARELRRRFRTVVTVFPDGYVKYQSEGLVHCREGACPYEHHPVV